MWLHIPAFQEQKCGFEQPYLPRGSTMPRTRQARFMREALDLVNETNQPVDIVILPPDRGDEPLTDDEEGDEEVLPADEGAGTLPNKVAVEMSLIRMKRRRRSLNGELATATYWHLCNQVLCSHVSRTNIPTSLVRNPS